jgi:hypothetical protein
VNRSLLIILVLAWIGLPAFAQEGLFTLEHSEHWRVERAAAVSGRAEHLDVRPMSFWTVQSQLQDANLDSAAYGNLPLKRQNRSYLRLMPQFSLGGFNQAGAGARTGFETMGGLGIGGGIKNKLYFSVDGIWGAVQPYAHISAITDSLRALPGWGYANRSIGGADVFGVNQISAVIAYKPSQYFELFAGRGRHFIGEGFRSMFLGDAAPNYNYAKADVNVWRLRYMVLYAQFDQSADYPSRVFPTYRKYSTMHYLTVKVNDYWKVGAFESVVWESEDSVINRGIDIHYLNPLIFFRPVEYGIGSSDNSLLGFTSTVQPMPELTLYGQFLLDEFVFGEWLAPIQRRISGDSSLATGWWGNKQSYQFGIKYHQPFGWKQASMIAEVNIVRPFTYGHSNRAQSFTHMNTPLAHPLGANFIEWVNVWYWQPKRWNISLISTYARKGYTNQIAVMGEDILVSNTDRDANNREHGNFLLQGRREDVANVRLGVGYTLIPNWNLRAEGTMHYRLTRTQGQVSDGVIIGFALRTALWNNHYNL